jgi:hypothetical protein
MAPLIGLSWTKTDAETKRLNANGSLTAFSRPADEGDA